LLYYTLFTVLCCFSNIKSIKFKSVSVSIVTYSFNLVSNLNLAIERLKQTLLSRPTQPLRIPVQAVN